VSRAGENDTRANNNKNKTQRRTASGRERVGDDEREEEEQRRHDLRACSLLQRGEIYSATRNFDIVAEKTFFGNFF